MKSRNFRKGLLQCFLKGASLLFILLAAFASEAKTIRVAVVDSGLNDHPAMGIKRCKGLDKDFTGHGLHDNYNHGTIVAGIIAQNNKDVDYCIAVLKVFDVGRTPHLFNTIKAFEYIERTGFDVVNYSGGGGAQVFHEKKIFKRLLDKGTKIVTVAGNESSDLDVKCNYYPACYDDRIIVVGALDFNGTRLKSSNYGKIVDYTVTGELVFNTGLKKHYYAGTSFATPLVTQALVRSMYKRNKK
jgi:subtilisin family serine protease